MWSSHLRGVRVFQDPRDVVRLIALLFLHLYIRFSVKEARSWFEGYADQALTCYTCYENTHIMSIVNTALFTSVISYMLAS